MVDLTTSVTLNGQSVTLTVYEDTTGDGVANNTESVSVATGTNTYTLSTLSGDTSYSYQIDEDLSGPKTSTPLVHSAEIGDLLDSPSGLTVTDGTADDFDLSWTKNDKDSTGEWQIYRSTVDNPTKPTDYTQIATVTTASTTTYTDTVQKDGRTFSYFVRRVAGGESKDTGTVSKAFGDVSQPTLGNGVEDEIAVSWTDAIDYGDYIIEYRETSSSTWLAGPTVGQATTSATISPLEDGEEYEVRMRTDAEYINGTWTSPVSIVTKFPGITNFAVGAVTKTSVDLSWTDNSDNEDGFDVERAKVYDSGPGIWRTLDTLAANTTTYTDGTSQPGREYQYRIRAFTEDAEAMSGTVTATTTGEGANTSPIPARGWYVEVDHPNTDVPLTPSVLDDPQWLPTLNGRPECRIPVPHSESWDGANFERAPMTVWNDGTQVEIDELHAVEHQTDRTVLVGRGGSSLRDRVQAEYANKEAHLAAQELINNNTPYTANVDDPADGGTETAMQSAATTSELNDALEVTPPAPTEPWEVSNGVVTTLTTAHHIDARTTNGSYQSTNNVEGGSSDYVDGFAAYLDSGTSNISTSINLPHTIPGSSVGLAVRQGADDTPAVEWKINGSVVDSVSQGAGQIVFDWDDVAAGGFSGGGGWTGGDLDGTVNIDIVVTANDGTEALAVDWIVLYDKRYHSIGNFDNSTDANDQLATPGEKPPSVDVPFAAVSTPRSVIGGRVETTFDDTTGSQAIALSNDGGTSYNTASNTQSFSTSFASGGGSLKFRATLSNYGSRTSTTPTQGFYGQSLDTLDTFATVEETPILTNKVYDGQLIDILQQIATFGNFIFEVRRDSTGTAVEWTQPGQRTASEDPAITDYSTKKQNTRYRKAVIYGASRPVSNDHFTANHGVAVDLTSQEIVEGKATVYDPGSGTQFVEDEDYSIDYSLGEITTLSSGTMTDGAEYAIDYSQRPSGQYEAGDFDATKHDTIVRTIPTASSNRECEQAALYLVDELGTPRTSASVTLSRLDAGQSLVDDLALGKLPVDSGMTIHDVQQGPREVKLEMGSRQRIGEAVKNLADRLASTERKV